jgi:oxygen-dependent protoporphyrinogen oxidase
MNRLIVVGGGISGLASAFRIGQKFASSGKPLEIEVLEAEDRPGGKIRSEQIDGYVFEWGPNGFLDGKPDTLDLCRDLGIESDLLESNDAARKRYVLSGGRLHRVPENPVAFFRSRLLSVRGRLRILAEPWIRRSEPGQDISISAFGQRRLGREAVEKLLDPMVSGIFAGDPALLSLAACFPRIAELERDYGSLVRAMVALARARRKGQSTAAGPGAGPAHVRKPSGPAGPAGTLVSFREGTERLIRALCARLGASLRTGCRVEAILAERHEQKPSYRLLCDEKGEKTQRTADAVVLAVPAWSAARILGACDAGAGALLAGIPYAPLVVVGLGFPEGRTPGALDGFGFLVPFVEGTPVLGSLWTSRIFQGRSPVDRVLTRNMVGGWRNPWVLGLDEDELEAMVLNLLEKATAAKGEVCFRRIVRHERAIPSYLLGHTRRLEKLEERLARFSGLYVTGNALRGVAINDCTREAVRMAEAVERDFAQGLWGDASK